MRRGRRRRGRAVHRHRAPHDAHLRSQGRLQRPALRHRIGDGHRRGDRPGSRKRRRGVVRRHRHRTRREHTAARRRRRRGVLVPPVVLGRGCEIIEAPARPRRTLRPLARHDEHPGLRRQHGLIRRRRTRRRPCTEAAREGGGHARDGGAAHRVRRRGMRVVFVRSVAVVGGERVSHLHRANERGSWRRRGGGDRVRGECRGGTRTDGGDDDEGQGGAEGDEDDKREDETRGSSFRGRRHVGPGEVRGGFQRGARFGRRVGLESYASYALIFASSRRRGKERSRQERSRERAGEEER
mmetsp:Transcript_5515/g.14815  ORF Transcript_5515/g.14815 Transcript_5515/m.14815 type:complete len:297 (-) Transcript_5515:564-1454(-)